MNIVFWNCQGLRPKLKELQNYLQENQIDTLALNETILNPKFNFDLPAYDIYKNDRLVGTKDRVAILVKKGIIVNQEWKKRTFQFHNVNCIIQLYHQLLFSPRACMDLPTYSHDNTDRVQLPFVSSHTEFKLRMLVVLDITCVTKCSLLCQTGFMATR